MNPRGRIAAVLMVTILAAPGRAEQPLGTSVTYQGQLKELNDLVTDTADFQFTLWDEAAAGSQVGSTISAPNVSVENGLFTQTLDFGAAAFAGDARWLEISVRRPHDPTDTAPYTTLTPRQPLTAAPYALHAANAGQWQTSGSAIMNSNTGFVGINRDYTVGLEWFGVHAPVVSGYGGMYVTTEGATAWPFYGYRAGAQVAWSYLDGGTGDWHLNVDGNRITVTDEGHVGIRTVTPSYPLHVASNNTDRSIYGENSTAAGVGVRGSATHAGGANAGVYGESASPNGVGVRGEAPLIGMHGQATSSGGIGVRGSAASGAGVGVSGFGASTGVHGVAADSATSGRGVFGQALAVSGATRGVWGDVASSTGYAGYFTGGRSYFEGSVGVGLTVPTHKLHVTNNASTSAVFGENSGSGAGVFGHQTATTGIRDGVGGRSDSTAGRGVFGWATSSIGNAYGVSGQTDSNAGRALYGLSTAASGTTYGVRAEVNSASGFAGYFVGPVGSRSYFQRSVGIGTTSPSSPLTVIGDADITGQVSIGIAGADARLLVRGVTGEDAFRVRVDSTTKVIVKDNGGMGIGANFSSVPTNGLRTIGAVGIGADPGAFTLVSNGDAAKPGGGLWSVFSDARLKRDIEPIAPGMLDRLLSLRGKTFEYIDDAVDNRLGMPGRQTGLIAQDVQRVFPEWVDCDDEGFLYVTERGLTAVVVEAMRELRTEKDAAIAALKSDNEDLRRRLNRIEAALSRLAAATSGGE